MEWVTRKVLIAFLFVSMIAWSMTTVWVSLSELPFWTTRDMAIIAPLQTEQYNVIPGECVELFDQVQNGTIQDPNAINGSSPTFPLYARSTTTRPAFGISIHNKKTDGVRWGILETGDYYERGVTRHAKAIFEEIPHGGGVLVDVGMNIGWFSLWALAHNQTVHSFEPNPMNRLRFCESVKLNQFPATRIHLYKYGVSDRHTTLSLSYSPGALGSAQLVDPANSRGGQTTTVEDVPVVTLDEMAQTAGFFNSEISLLKIDVEGHDAAVLNGAKDLLQSGNVKNIFMEFKCETNNHEAMRNAANQLSNAGFFLEVVGNWAGHPLPGSDTVIRTNQDIAQRLYSFCRGQLKGDETKTIQMNLWWKLGVSHNSSG